MQIIKSNNRFIYINLIALSMLTVHTLLPMDNPYKNIVQEIEAAIQDQEQSVVLLEQLAKKCGAVNTLVAEYSKRSFGNSPLHFAVSFCDKNTNKYTANPIACAWFLDHGVDVDLRDGDDRTPLHKVLTGECAELLIKYGARIEAIEQREGHTPLHDAASSGNLAVINVLLKYGAIRVNSTMFDGSTPLHVAHSVAIVEALIKAGGNIHAQNAYTGEPIHSVACSESHDPKIFDVLIKAGAIINTPGHNGNTPLHFAVDNSNEEAVRWLLTHGASTNVCDNNKWGHSYLPIHYAQKKVDLYSRDYFGSKQYERATRIVALLKLYKNQ